MEIIDVKHIILESKAEMCIYGLLNLKQNGIDLSFSNKHGQENKKNEKQKILICSC
jgi:hypothetical protein